MKKKFEKRRIILKIPFVRRYYYKYLRGFARKHKDLELITTITRGIIMNLTLKDAVQYMLFIDDVYEPHETSLWLNYSKNSSTIIDIGANVGYYSLLAASVNKAARIISFEPISKTYNRFVENIEMNSYKNITAVRNAVSNKSETIRINLGNENNWGMSSINQHDYLSGSYEDIESVTLDEYVKNNCINGVDLIKIDIEGAEFYALLGMRNILEEMSPVIFVEVLEQHLSKQNISVEKVFSFLWDFGYRSYTIGKNNKLSELSAPISVDGLILFKK